jgi:putative tricarboxylic transport membrane protein
MTRDLLRHKVVRMAVLALFAVLCLAVQVQAGEFKPTKPIQLIAAAAPGGGTDLLARTIAQIVASEKLSPQPLIVQNIPGGGSAIGTTQVAGMKGDTHTLLAMNSATVSGLLTAGKGAATVRDLTMIAQLALDEQFIVVRSDSRFKSIKEIVAESKKKENALSIAGADQADRICSRLFEKGAGIKMRFVQFNSSGEAMTALLGGHVDMIWANASEFGSQYDAKMVVPLVVAQEKRFPQYKDVPTFRENGLDVIFQFFRGVVAPPGLSPEVVAYYENMMKNLNDTKAWKENYLAKYFLNPGWQGSKEFTKTVYDSEAIYEETLKSLGLIK